MDSPVSSASNPFDKRLQFGSLPFLSVFPLYFISKRLFKSTKAVYSTPSHSGTLIQEFQWIINYLRFVWMDSRYGQDLLEINIEWT